MTIDNWAFLAMGVAIGVALSLAVWLLDGWAARRHQTALVGADVPDLMTREEFRAQMNQPADGRDNPVPVVRPGQPCPSGPHLHGGELRRAQLTPREAAEFLRFVQGVEAREEQLSRAGDETAAEAEAFLDDIRTKSEDRKNRPYNQEEDGGP